jgi:hypothetical protein
MGVEVGCVVQCIGVVYGWNMELLEQKNKDASDEQGSWMEVVLRNSIL